MEEQDSPLGKIYVSYSSKDNMSLILLKNAADAMNKKVNSFELVSSNHDLKVGESISRFMAELCTHPMIVINLSQNYLQSPYCLFELFYIDWYLERNHSATGPVVWLVGDDKHNLRQLNSSIITSTLEGEEGISVLGAIEDLVRNGDLLDVEVGDIPGRFLTAFDNHIHPVIDKLNREGSSNLNAKEVIKKSLQSEEESFKKERVDLLAKVNESFRVWHKGLGEEGIAGMGPCLTKFARSDQIDIGRNVAVFFNALRQWLEKPPKSYFQNSLNRQKCFERLDTVVGWHFLLTVDKDWWREHRNKFHSLRQTVPAYPATDRNRFIIDATFSLSTLDPVKLETDGSGDFLQPDIDRIASDVVSHYGEKIDLDIADLETSGEAWVEFFLQVLVADLTNSPTYAKRSYSSHSNKVESLIEEVAAQVNSQWIHNKKRTYYILPKRHYRKIETECLPDSKTLLQLLDEETEGHLCFVQWERIAKKDALKHKFVSDVITSLGHYAQLKARIMNSG